MEQKDIDKFNQLFEAMLNPEKADAKPIDTKIIRFVIGVTTIAWLVLYWYIPTHPLLLLCALLPLIVIHEQVVVAGEKGSKHSIAAVVGFLIPVVPFILLISVDWFFGSGHRMESVIFFFYMPGFCFVLGAIGYVIGYAISHAIEYARAR